MIAMVKLRPYLVWTLLGLCVGVALGLLYAWQLDPVTFVNSDPTLLRADFRQDWVHLAALSYSAEGDVQRYHARVESLPRVEVEQALNALIERYAAQGGSATLVRKLSELALAEGFYTPAMLVYLGTPTAAPPTGAPSPVSPTPALPAETPASTTPATATVDASPTPRPLAQPSPTRTPDPARLTAVPLSGFRLVQKERLCDAAHPGRVAVVVQSGAGSGVAGVEIWLTWAGGADRATSGLKPELGLGYLDFMVRPGLSYAVSTGNSGFAVVDDLVVAPCAPADGEAETVSSWRLVLEQVP